MEINFYLYKDGERQCGLYGAMAQFVDTPKTYTDSPDRRDCMIGNLNSKLGAMKESWADENSHPILQGLAELHLADTQDRDWEFDELRIYSTEGELVGTYPIENMEVKCG